MNKNEIIEKRIERVECAFFQDLFVCTDSNTTKTVLKMKRLFGGGGTKAPPPTLDDAVKRVKKT